MQIFAYRALHIFLDSTPTFNDLVNFHTSYKYIVYSKSHNYYKSLGNIVANHNNQTIDVVLEKYKKTFLEVIAQKGTIKNTYNVLLHIYGYFKKLISRDEKEDILETIEDFKKGIIPLITAIKIINLYIKKFDIKYLKTQIFLNPYPKDLALRSKVEAFK